MAWIQPLEMETWFVNVLAGNPDIFGGIAIFVIAILAGYLRMNTFSMFLMLGIFVLMFSGFIGATFLILFAILGGLIVGLALSRLFN
jgi:hypothetical protein